MSDLISKENKQTKSTSISDFERKLGNLINFHSRDAMSDTPDFILAKFLNGCLTAFAVAVASRDFNQPKKDQED